MTIEYHCDLCSDLITLPQNEYYDTDYQVCVKPMENHYSDGELARKPKNCEGKIYHVCMHCKDKLEMIFKKDKLVECMYLGKLNKEEDSSWCFD